LIENSPNISRVKRKSRPSSQKRKEKEHRKVLNEPQGSSYFQGKT